MIVGNKMSIKAAVAGLLEALREPAEDAIRLVGAGVGSPRERE